MINKQEISISELKRIELSILKKVTKFCDDNHLIYFLLAGTALGAVRHKGFIPWDDDIDIGLPRKDYERFIETYNDEAYEVLEYSKDRNYPYAFAKVIDNGTVLIEPTNNTYPLGVYIDVFPIDGLQGDDRQRETQSRRAIRYSRMLIYKSVTTKYETDYIHRLYHIILRMALLPFSRRWIIEKQIKNAKRYSYENCDYIGVLVVRYYTTGGNVKKEYFGEGCFGEFEGEMFRLPSDCSSYLKWKYGDYMKIPPVEQRKTHHYFTVYYKEGEK